MVDDVIGMGEMQVIFFVTDALGIDREQVSVPLEKRTPGAVRRLPSGEVEIVVPLTASPEKWALWLKEELESLLAQEK